MWSGQALFKEGSQQLQKQPAVGQWKPLASSGGGKVLPPLECRCREASGGDDQSTAQLNVSRLRSSSVEIREKGAEFLKEELHRAQKELKLKDEECERLSKVREQLEQELEELTASLFEEAHKMVRDANTKQAASEKQLREARGKIDMLQAEVTALKTLVITSTPSSPNRELHPQLQSPSKTVFRKGHGRNKSASSAVVSATSQSLPLESVSNECREVDSILFAEFQAWKESPTLEKSCSFLERIYREDVGPCLDFTKQELSELVQEAVEQNTLTIEPVATQVLPVVKVSAMKCGGPNGFRSHIVTLEPTDSGFLQNKLPRRTCVKGQQRNDALIGREDEHKGRLKELCSSMLPENNTYPLCGWTIEEEVRSERPVPILQTPHQAGGFWELLLHLTILPGQDHSRVQLLHLHSLHPAGLGETGCGADVLGNYAAQEGNVHGQAGLLPQCDVGRASPSEGSHPRVNVTYSSRQPEAGFPPTGFPPSSSLT